MPSRGPALLAGLALALAGCAGSRASISTTHFVVEVSPEEGLLDLITAVMRADARLEPATPLYAEGATTIANGEPRHFPPRYAGLAPGGDVSIISSRVELRGSVAWALVDYQWISTTEGAVREGVASFLMVPAAPGGVGWRILHAHSSSPGG